MLAKYGCIMFPVILQKHVLSHNFLTKARRMMILVSRTMFWGSRNQMMPFISSCIWPCLSSHLWIAWNWSLSCLPIAEMTSIFFTCASLGLYQPPSPYQSACWPNMGALCFPPFCKNTFWAITFELKHIGWWFWCLGLCFQGQGISWHYSFWS